MELFGIVISSKIYEHQVWQWVVNSFKRYGIGLAMWGFPSKDMELVEAMGLLSQDMKLVETMGFPSKDMELVWLWGFP